jgi:hypothetical protein
MPIAHVRGININYEVLGAHGPWIALSPGGRRALDNVKSLAQHVADAGYRVLIHDRRNCGLSDIAIGAEASEYEVWAEDRGRQTARCSWRWTRKRSSPPCNAGARNSPRAPSCRSSARASERDLNSLKVPTCIIPGNDKTHNHAIAEAARRMIAGSELHDLFPGDLDVDLVPPEDWAPKEGEMAAVFTDFLKRAQAKAA